MDYSSDDSSPPTEDEPRRVPGSDLALLDTMDPEMRSKVEALREALPGCPVSTCQQALLKCDQDRGRAKAATMRTHGYTGLEGLDRETEYKILTLQDTLPFHRSIEHCRSALARVNGDYAAARRYLLDGLEDDEIIVYKGMRVSEA